MLTHAPNADTLPSSCAGPGYQFKANVSVPDDVARHWRHGYYAAVSYVDSNIGKVLASLEALGLADNTVVGLIADHGEWMV